MPSTEDGFRRAWLEAVVATFRYHKNLADRAIAQVSWVNLRKPLDEHTNSIAVVMKHVAGNLASRWTDFLTSDGEKPWRNRDDEFVDGFTERDELAACWEQGWAVAFAALEQLTPADCERTITIRGDTHTVPMAIERSLGHTSYHIGQIVIVARHWAGDAWETLTIPRGGSASFNRLVWGTSDYRNRTEKK